MKLYFGLIVAALVVAALSGGALLWDGSYYLYSTLNSQAPFLPNNRYIAVVLETPVLLAFQITHNITVLKAVFGLTYALVPLISLLLCWLIVRRTAPALFVWAALGFGFGTLMLQLHFIAEATLSVQLMWPVVLAALTPPRWWVRGVVILLSLAAFFSHPFALALFAVVAGLAASIGWRYREQRLEKWLWAAGFVALAAAGVLRFTVNQTNYETDQISLAILESHYQTALKGVPLIALSVVALAAAIIFAVPYLRRWQGRRLGTLDAAQLIMPLYLAELVSLLAAGVLFGLWAAIPRLWEGALDYRTWVLFVSLPFMGLAGLESLAIGSQRAAGLGSERTHRVRTVQVIGLIFTIVIGLQSWSWLNVTWSFQAEVAQYPGACVSSSSLLSVLHTSLYHWSLTPYSLILQGFEPHQIVLYGNCGQTDFKQGVPIASWDLHRWATGQFDMHLLFPELVRGS
jgi:hypothetical protein